MDLLEVVADEVLFVVEEDGAEEANVYLSLVIMLRFKINIIWRFWYVNVNVLHTESW